MFLSGTNPAWINYGNDFGNDQWEQSGKDRWTQELQDIGNAGGNSARVWIHVEGDYNPQYDSDGYVVGTDAADTLISDLRYQKYQNYALKKLKINILKENSWTCVKRMGFS